MKKQTHKTLYGPAYCRICGKLHSVTLQSKLTLVTPPAIQAHCPCMRPPVGIVLYYAGEVTIKERSKL
jgi:hypothetical protein